MNRKLTAALLVTAAVTTNAAFTALGAVFDYPDVLKQPVDEVLAAFRASQGTVSAWFGVMALSAALFAPIAVGVGGLSTRRTMRLAVPVGVAAATVQVIGLLRWPLLVPGYAADAAGPDPAVAQPRVKPSPRHTGFSEPLSERRSATPSPPSGRCWSWPRSDAGSPGPGSPSPASSPPS